MSTQHTWRRRGEDCGTARVQRIVDKYHESYGFLAGDVNIERSIQCWCSIGDGFMVDIGTYELNVVHAGKGALRLGVSWLCIRRLSHLYLVESESELGAPCKLALPSTIAMESRRPRVLLGSTGAEMTFNFLFFDLRCINPCNNHLIWTDFQELVRSRRICASQVVSPASR